jgi:hypothetical protein
MSNERFVVKIVPTPPRPSVKDPASLIYYYKTFNECKEAERFQLIQDMAKGRKCFSLQQGPRMNCSHLKTIRYLNLQIKHSINYNLCRLIHSSFSRFVLLFVFHKYSWRLPTAIFCYALRMFSERTIKY